jgi:adenosylmethionine-8-amino-7-oxononanoate aminotransferase
MALTYQGLSGRSERNTVVARRGSYHGNTLGALDLSSRPHLRTPYEPWLGRFRHVGDDPAELERDLAKGDVAAFVAEPISGASRGATVPPDDYWPTIAALCRSYDVLFVVDEVMTGFGRTGAWFAIEHWGVEPDLMICGKGASSGYWPLGLAIASGRVFEVIGERFVHGYTYSHHPAGAAVGMAVLDILTEEDLVAAAARQGERLRVGLKEALGERVTDVRGKGLLVGVAFDDDPQSVVSAARNQGLLVYPAAIPAVLLGPPLVITDEEVDQIVERLSAALHET